MTRNLETGSN